MLEGMNLENLAKWTCVDVCVVWWWMMNGVWFDECVVPSKSVSLSNYVSPANQFSLLNYGVSSKQVFTVEFYVANELVFRCQIVVLAVN
jgi:hypothetical protein